MSQQVDDVTFEERSGSHTMAVGQVRTRHVGIVVVLVFLSTKPLPS